MDRIQRTEMSKIIKRLWELEKLFCEEKDEGYASILETIIWDIQEIVNEEVEE